MPLVFNGGFTIVNSYISKAVFSVPTTLGSITIQNITGDFASFQIVRTGGIEGTFTSNLMYPPTNTYTDPTVLSDNTQYTYNIVTFDSNGKVGATFTQIYNPSTKKYNSKIYTFANILLASPTFVNSNGSQNSIYLSWTNSGYSNIYIQNITKSGPIIGYTAASNVTSYDSKNYEFYSNSINKVYVYNFYVSNSDGVINPNIISVNTSTWATNPSTVTYLDLSSNINSVTFSFSGGRYKSISLQSPLGTEIATTSISPYFSPNIYSPNQQITYYLCPKNAVNNYSITNYISVNTCTWAKIDSIYFTNTTTNSTTINLTGTFNGVYITYSGVTATPASGIIVNGANTITQNYSNITNGTMIFYCYPINLFNNYYYHLDNSVNLFYNSLINYKFKTTDIYDLSYVYNWASGAPSTTSAAIADISLSPPYIQTNQYITINGSNSATSSNCNFSVYGPDVNPSSPIGAYTTPLYGGYSIAFWFFPLQGAGNRAFYMNGYDTNYNDALNEFTFGSVFSNWKYSVYFWPPASSRIPLLYNSWNHIVMIYYNNPVSKKYYLNGEYMSTYSSFMNGITTLTTKIFSLGGATDIGNNHKGYYQDFRFYNSTLTNIQIQQLYNSIRLTELTWTKIGSARYTSNYNLTPWYYFDVSGIPTGSYAYINSGVDSLLGKSISFHVHLFYGNPSLYFACDVSGSGQMLQIDISNNTSGFSSSTSWTNRSYPSLQFKWATGRWIPLVISIDLSGVAKWSGNGIYSGDTLNISNNGNYIGFSCDVNSKMAIENIQLHNFEHSMVSV